MPEKEESLIWKDKTGTYKMGYSQKLMREQLQWQKINFAGKVALIAVILILIIIILYVLYKLDSINFFTGILYR
ncbi:MAG: hypothetical protein CMH63_02610 [Nanoarchaeota archaeon]|jgi:hypothetical protein|nr:hypothetical protein [Nanoarchaeota archaeon]|tara:strand:+ start:19396 stop:19617 length:222 start_codon:yes stop_codon:yes gene_type:complete